MRLAAEGLTNSNESPTQDQQANSFCLPPTAYCLLTTAFCRQIISAVTQPANGTVVIRNGLIDAVGPDTATPAAAIVIEGAGLTVYPGLIDMGTSTGLDVPTNQPRPEGLRTMEEVERWKRTQIFRPELMAAERLHADSTDLARLASYGVTSVLAAPLPGEVDARRGAARADRSTRSTRPRVRRATPSSQTLTDGSSSRFCLHAR